MAMHLTEALQSLDDRMIPFNIKFVSFDESRNKGGEVIELSKCVKVGASHDRKENDTMVVKQVDRDAHPYTIHKFLIMEVNGNEVFI